MIRIFDVILSLIATIILLPFMIPVMIILKCTGEHYIFYSQKRIGKSGKEFDMLKFATMLRDSPSIGPGEITLKDDERVLPFGKILRKTKINELPQIVNILIGQMSIVGPRPLTPKAFNNYSEQEKEIILKMKPGLTGIGSIIFRSEELLFDKNRDNTHDYYKNVIAPYKAKLENWYFHKKSFSIYIAVIFLTAISLFIPKNKLIWKIFKDLPSLPPELKELQ